MTRWLGLWCALAAAALVAAPAAAEEDVRLVLQVDDARLRRAIGVALAPWGVAIVTAREQLGRAGSTMAESAEAARRLASTADADVVAWLTTDGERRVMAVYDASHQRLLARPVAEPPPYDDATAAALALALKTLLRHSDAAPLEERALTPADRAAAEGNETSAGAPHVGRGPFTSAGETTTTPVSRPRRQTRVGVGLALRSFDVAGHVVEPRAQVLVERDLGLAQKLTWGIGGDVNFGGGATVATAPLYARYAAHTLRARVHLRRHIAPHFALAAAGGLGVRLATLDGALVTPDDDVHVVRVTPLVTASLGAGWFSGAAGIRLSIGTDVALVQTSFAADGRAVLRPRRAPVDVELVLTLAVD